MPASEGLDERLSTLDKIAELANVLQPRDFVELMYAVVADMAEEGVPMEELAVLCSRVSDRVALQAGRYLH